MTDSTTICDTPTLLFTSDFAYREVTPVPVEPPAKRQSNSLLAPPPFSSKRTRRASSPGPGTLASTSELRQSSNDDLSSGTGFGRQRARSRTTGAILGNGELTPPPPPLFRPNTFWRHTRRSAVTGPAYSPAAHVVRRAAFVAAGLAPDRSDAKQAEGEAPDVPRADLSALAVESRVGRVVLVPGFTGEIGMSG